MRDGLNLVAKEYVACHPEGDGVLVLSEFAGAASEMGEAYLINPYDEERTADLQAVAVADPEWTAAIGRSLDALGAALFAIAATDKEIADYYNANQATYGGGETRDEEGAGHFGSRATYRSALFEVAAVGEFG